MTRKNKLWISAAGILLAAGLIILRTFSPFSQDKPAVDQITFIARKGPLTISVTESGVIKARDQVIIKSELEGKTSILWLIPEGTQVREGDLLVELDASQLLDSKIDQQIQVQNAEAAFINARENLAVVKNQAQSDEDKAALTLEFARQDLKKYEGGEYPNQLKEAEAKITLAQEELTRGEDTLKWSQTLFAEKYISQSELQADELSAQKKAMDLDLARNNLSLLRDFTHQRTLAQLKSDVKQAEMALERTKRKARADVVQAEADLQARESELNRQKDKLVKVEKQINKTKIYAPAAGLVIYASSAQGGGRHGQSEPLAEGQEIYERQELIYLPTGSSVKAEVDVHEANLQKVRLDLPVKVTVDALSGQSFRGRVAKIAPLPDPQSAWLNPDLKVYNTEIYLDDDNTFLRTGMSCQAEIIIAHYDEAVYIPIQAVLLVGRKPTVYVVKGRELEPRVVETGLDNNRMVRIIKGLQSGEMVTLTPPLAAASVEGDKPGLLPAHDTVPNSQGSMPRGDSLKNPPSGEGEKRHRKQPGPELQEIQRKEGKESQP